MDKNGFRFILGFFLKPAYVTEYFVQILHRNTLDLSSAAKFHKALGCTLRNFSFFCDLLCSHKSHRRFPPADKTLYPRLQILLTFWESA